MSETMKHTLEPWQVRTDLDGKPKLDSRDGYTVERADPTAGKPFVVSAWSLDNARLIAAAPEMLEALKVALPQLQDNARFLRDIQAHAGKVVDAFDAVKAVEAAIAKAEGRT